MSSAVLDVADSGQLILGTPPLETNNNTGDIRHDASNTVLLTTQLLIVVPFGGLCFLLFCFLRTRWNAMYAPRIKLIKLAPDALPDSFFGWIIPLFNIPESKVIKLVGLDATVLLAFFKMSFKLFAFCGFFSLVIIPPIKLSFKRGGKGGNGDNPNDPTVPDDSEEMLISYVILTWVFSLATYYFTFYNYREFSIVRHEYYLKWKDTVAARSVMVTVIPSGLQTDSALKDFYNSLNLGPVENATVYRHVRKLRHAIEKRAQYLKKLEDAYVEYLGNPCEDPNYDPVKATKAFEDALRDDPKNAKNANDKVAAVLVNVKAKRPMMSLGLFGKKVDKISYYTEKFIHYDQQVTSGRSGAYVSTSTGFVTFKNIDSAQIAAQVLIRPEPFQCSTELAPEPRDVFWYKLNIRNREKFIRDILVNCLVILFAFSWTVPIAILASFLSLDTLKKTFPWLAALAEDNKLLRYFIQGPLPTLAIVALNSIVPQTLEFLSRQQGIKSRSSIEFSTFSKYFFFLLFNIILIFTIVGTVINALIDFANNPIGIPLTLAKNLPRVAPFFVNYVILQGIGLYPTRILMIKDIAMTYLLRVFFANTPRDFADASTPPFINYGQELPPVILIFVIVLVYSSLTPIILLFGTIYFLFGYICYKYLFLFVYFHPYESAGIAWPKLFRRITIGLYLFQLLMIGYMSLKKSFYLAVAITPLLVITGFYFYYVNEAYDRSSAFVPLNRLHREKNLTSSSDVSVKRSSRDSAVLSEIMGGNIDILSMSNYNENNMKEEQGHSHRDVLENDLYYATPDSYTDYSQPPMSLYHGLLDTGMRHYTPPEITGTLPWLWLPAKKIKGNENGGIIRRLLGMNIKVSKSGFAFDPTNDSTSIEQDGPNQKAKPSKTVHLDNEEAESSTPLLGQSTSYGAITTDPEEVVVSNDVQPSTSSAASSQPNTIKKRKSRVRMMTEKLGELAGSNFS